MLRGYLKVYVNLWERAHEFAPYNKTILSEQRIEEVDDVDYKERTVTVVRTVNGVDLAHIEVFTVFHAYPRGV